MTLSVGEHLLIRYKTGDSRWRHGVIVSPASGTSRKVLTPARAIRDIDFASTDIDKILAWDGVTLPKKVKAADAFIDLNSKQGKFSQAEIDDAVNGAEPRRRMRGKSAPLPVIDRDPTPPPSPARERRPLRSDEEPTPALHSGPVADGEGWYVLLGIGACVAGHPVSLKGVEHVLFGRFAFFKKGDKDLVAFWAKAEELTEKLRELRIMASGYGKERFGDLEELYADTAGTPRDKPARPPLTRATYVFYPCDTRRTSLGFVASTRAST